jgi:hypothetical protein
MTVAQVDNAGTSAATGALVGCEGSGCLNSISIESGQTTMRVTQWSITARSERSFSGSVSGWAVAHAIAAVVENATRQDGGRVIEAHLSCPGVLCEQGLDSLEGGTIDGGGMLARMSLTPVDHLADVEAILEKMRQGAHAVRTTTLDAAICEVRTFDTMFRLASSSARAPTEPHWR